MDGQSASRPRAAISQSVTLPMFGKRLRGHFGDAAAGLDDEMIALLEKLLDVPGLAEGVGVAPAPDRVAERNAR